VFVILHVVARQPFDLPLFECLSTAATHLAVTLMLPTGPPTGKNNLKSWPYEWRIEP